MNKSTEKDYNEILESCRQLKDELHSQIEEFLKKEHPEVGYHMGYGRIKPLESIEGKINAPGEIKVVLDCEDLVGLRVICHCLSDIANAVAALKSFLKKKGFNPRLKNHSKEAGYQALHLLFKVKSNGVAIPCEIQVRTVLQDAWAVQSRRFLYKREIEGESKRLGIVVSGILSNCEDIWELVREKSTDALSDLGKPSIETAKYVLEVEKILREEAKKKGEDVDFQDRLDEAFSEIEIKWNELKELEMVPGEGMNSLGKMELAMEKLKIIGLLAIKKDNANLLEKVLQLFGKILALVDVQKGTDGFQSILFAILHNAYYYFGAFAIKNESKESLVSLLNFKIKFKTYRFNILPIWRISSIFAPNIINSAIQTFDRMRECYRGEDESEIRGIMAMDEEEFLTNACKFNLLFALKVMQEQQEKPEDRVWVYPNFARFYANRVIDLVLLIRDTKEYEDFVKAAFGESLEVFNENTEDRIRMLHQRGVGGNYWWESIRTWNEIHQ
ncbi:MAG: RelA/SpoT domain-containing protein [Candidatus Peregrinibacteria bacterium GW2011_GWA2_44_7]|nr:MAG: RelA/SpoT domain-containing protein [Candidatus Peregrinibacteria bacterium GW2011_GWA2_44_7]